MKKLKKILFGLLIPFAIGGVVGFLIIRLGRSAGEYESNLLVYPLLLIISSLISLYLHIIIHEIGHLIGGKLSGYTFVSFRVGGSVFIRKNDKFARKKFAVAGTAGQCLMSPPEVVGEQYEYPFILYNFSGGLANILLAIPFFIIGLLTSPGHVSVVFLTAAFAGIVLGLMNLVPLKLNGIANDGLNIFNCRKKLKSRRALWIQLKYVALITKGVRIRDMPQDWVENIGIPTDALIGFLATLRCSYLLDKGEIEQAAEYIKITLESPGGILELQKNELRCELLFCELIGECRTDEIEKLYTAPLRKHIKIHAVYVSKHRLMYAYEKLYKKNETDAEKALAGFEKACLHTPFEGEIAGERELIELVNAKS